MFSSGLSLRNNIKEIDNELTAYTISNDARVVILETFKTNLEGTGEGSIQDLIDKHDSQASSISNLETSSTALQERINTFNAALEDGSDGIISTIEQIELNRSGLVSEISTRASAISGVQGSISSEASSRASADSSLGGRIDGEIFNRGLAISGEGASRVAGDAAEATARTAAIAIEATARTAGIAAEASLRLAGDVAEAAARNAAIAVETVNRQAAITAETTARQLAIQAESTLRSAAIQVEATARDNAVKAEAVARAKDIAKIGFISTAEAEGILEVGTYPFCFGMGNQSDLNYGLPLPFSYTLQSIAYTSIATTTNHSIIFNIVHYPFNTNEGPTILQNSVAVSGKYTIVSIKAVAPSAGNLVVEIVSTQNLIDDNGKYRLSFILTSNDSL